MPGTIYTIGHSNHSEVTFLRLLMAHNITAIADVRTHPYSRFCPHFSRERLKIELKSHGVRYAFFGLELGARPVNPNCYVNGKVQYDRLAQTDSFQRGLRQLVHSTQTYRIALLCAEKDPITCHRAILVCRYLASYDVTALHILANGEIESHDAAMSRLLNELGLTNADLFRNRAEMISEAYNQRGEQIAYSQEGLREAALENPQI